MQFNARGLFLYAGLNILCLAAIYINEAPSVALGFDPAIAGAVRIAFNGYVFYAVCLTGALIFALVFGLQRLLSLTLKASSIWIPGGAAVFALTLAAALAYINDLVYTDFGVHIYEFNLWAFITDPMARKHIGVRAEDMARLYSIGGALILIQLTAFAGCHWAGRRTPGRLVKMLAAAFTAAGLAGLAVYHLEAAKIPRNNLEFFDSLPFGSQLLGLKGARPAIPVTPRLGAGAYPLLGSGGPIPKLTRRKNIVIVIFDSLRDDYLKPGYDDAPCLKAAIKRFQPIVSQRHYSASHYTDQSFFGLIHGVDAHCYMSFLKHKVPCFPLDVFTANGWRTSFFTHSYLNQFPTNWLYQIFQESSNVESDPGVAGRFEKFLQTRKEKKESYLAVLFFYVPHWPYEFGPEYARHEPHMHTPFKPEEMHLAFKNSYKNSISQADAYFSQVYEAVSSEIESGRTALIVTSDHGTEFWEHEQIIGQGKATFWNEKIRVPFIVFDQDMKQRTPLGRLALSCHADIMPTLLDLAGVDDREVLKTAFDGRSLLEEAPPQRDILVTGRLFPYANRTNAIISKDRKYWFRAFLEPESKRLEITPFRALDLDDRSAQAENCVWDETANKFNARFFRFLKIGPTKGEDNA